MEKHHHLTLKQSLSRVSFNTDSPTDTWEVSILQERQQRDSPSSYSKPQQLQEVVKTANGCLAQREAELLQVKRDNRKSAQKNICDIPHV